MAPRPRTGTGAGPVVVRPTATASPTGVLLGVDARAPLHPRQVAAEPLQAVAGDVRDLAERGGREPVAARQRAVAADGQLGRLAELVDQRVAELVVDGGQEPGVVAGAELERRRADWKLPPPRYETGALAKYAKLVGSAAQGAVCG